MRLRPTSLPKLFSLLKDSTAIIGRRRRDRHKPKPKPKQGRLGRIMGQESSSPLDESIPPETLTSRTLEAVAEYIKDGKAQRIVVLTGAGISTAAGIPDFRSPGTGLYANLARLNLPYAEAVFDIDYFRKNPDPFYVLARELYPGKFHPTVSHAFIALLAQKGLLQKLFTQNIDCLERRAGVPDDKIVEAHGSFATQRCIDCKTEYPDDGMLDHVHRGAVPRCEDKACGGLVKPDIVFFGEPLPKEFERQSYQLAMADLVLVIGTSLSVYPFAALPDMTESGKPRMLFNLERVGKIGGRADDVLVLEDCDSGIRKLADELGWREELEMLWKGVVGDEEAKRQKTNRNAQGAEVDDEVNKLTEEMETALKIEEPAAVGGDEIKAEAVERDDTRNAAPRKADNAEADKAEPTTEEKNTTDAGAESSARDADTVPEKGAEDAKDTKITNDTKDTEKSVL